MADSRDLVQISSEVFADIRAKKNKSMTELSLETDISRNTLTRLESGRASSMGRARALSLAKALGVSLSAIERTGESAVAAKSPILSFMGLNQIPAPFDDSVPFCEWSITQSNQPLSHAWWSVDLDKLALRIAGEYLRAEFVGRHDDRPPNFGCQPFDHIPRALMEDQNAIGVAIYAAKGTNIAVSVRVSDKEGREWEYVDATHRQPMHQFELRSRRWTSSWPMTD